MDDCVTLSLALEPSEKLVWTGEPRPWALAGRSLGWALLGLGHCVFALIIWNELGRGGRLLVMNGRPFAPVLFVLVTVGTVAINAFLLSGPLRAYWRAKRTFYALTNRRVMISEPRLVGGRRVRAFSPDRLNLMKCKQRSDGSGDLIFDVRKDLSGLVHPVGFLSVDRVREIEDLVRRSLPLDDRESVARVETATRVWRLRIIIRCHFGLVCLFLLLFAAFWLITGSVWLAMVVVGLISGRRELDPIVLAGLAALVAVGVPLRGLVFKVLHAIYRHWFMFPFEIPFEIAIDADRTVTFRNWFRTRIVPVDDIVSIRVGGWLDPFGGSAVVRHKQGAVHIFNYFPNFLDFVSTAKALNPSIDVRIF
jgi:hypothetical protein